MAKKTHTLNGMMNSPYHENVHAYILHIYHNNISMYYEFVQTLFHNVDLYIS